MWNDIKRIDSSEGNVCKFVYTKNNAVAESVLYKYPTYEERTVICCSTQSGCPVGCRFCLPPDEMILTDCGQKRIKDFVVGDTVVSYRDGSRLINTVIKTMCNDYDGDLIEIELENGQKIVLTPNHEVLTDKGWVPCGDIAEYEDLIVI